MAKREKLWYNPDDGIWIAQTAIPSLGVWQDVSASYKHQVYAALDGHFMGSNPQPDDLCKKDSEHGHQTALFSWAALLNNVGISADLSKMFAIPNGGKRDAATAANLVAEGVRKGVPDTFLPVPVVVWRENQNQLQAVFGDTVLTNNVLSGLFIEMKKPKGGRESEEQKARIAQLRRDGYAVKTCKTWREARDVIVCYLSLHEKIKEHIEQKEKELLTRV
ncbi:TPA: VRR-NUC domain-containing protein [Salmonella enterica]|uniref:Putative endonuclease n=2 Tax=Lokivirus IMEAB3 TaxID=2560266 RepID=A0A481S224_9CAUD|nr:putative endonuclease [Acinetobacter phage IMEAB3]AHI60051.1 putative endonuclease [Acinetobacter phage IMEAB3]QBG78710.1 putative endonuclease [Acinetobacter phage vB_AbaS_D0]HCH8284993.1 VRR-NUC domain-containing protein [Salmonella enterica]